MKIAIAGYGAEGQANYEYFSRDPENELTIVDERETLDVPVPEGVATILGPDAFKELSGFDMVIRTPGLSPYEIKTDGKVWSATNEFFARCPADIIGVTGSKGKGTTASLIASILKAAGRTVWLVGNIGLPSLEVLDRIKPDDIVVYELSSFQLWDIERSPKTAVVLYIEQEHLDVHRDMADYVSAKANITRFQRGTDLLIFNRDNEFAAHIAGESNARKVGYPDEATAHIFGDHFAYGTHVICPVSSLRIPGQHNVSNAVAAIDAVWQYVTDDSDIEAGLKTFTGLPHRLAYVASVDGVDYYDDGIATTPTSAVAALRAFDGSKVIILGGSSKGSDFTELASELTRHDVTALLIGDEAERIAEAARTAGFEDFEIIREPSMRTVVRRARELARPGSVVLLSPSAASFGWFRNYADRGDQFIAAVQELEKEPTDAAAA